MGEPSSHVPLRWDMLVVGEQLPLGTTLTGKINMVWGSLVRKGADTPRLTLTIQTMLPIVGAPANDYVASSTSKLSAPSVQKRAIKLSLLPTGVPDMHQLEEDRQHCCAVSAAGRPVSVDVGGLRIITVGREGQKWDAELEGEGERVFKGDKTSCRVLAPSQVDATPSWFDTPSVASSSSSALDLPPKLRPLSSHLPTLTRPLIPPRVVPSAVQSSTAHDPAALPRPTSPSLKELPPNVVQVIPPHLRARCTSPVPSFPPLISHTPQSHSKPAPEPDPPSSPLFPVNLTAASVAPPPPAQAEKSLPTPRTTPAGSSPVPSETTPSQSEELQVMRAKMEELERKNAEMALQIKRSRSEEVLSWRADEDGRDMKRRRVSEGIMGGDNDMEEVDVFISKWDKRHPSRVASGSTSRGWLGDSNGEEISRLQQRREAEERARSDGLRRQEETAREASIATNHADRLKRGLEVQSVTYTPFNLLRNYMVVNVIGVVVEVMPVKKSALDHHMSIVLADPSTHTEGRASNDFQITIFRKSPADLPQNLNIGMSMLFRGIKCQKYGEKIKGNAYSGTPVNTWAYLSGDRELVMERASSMVPPLQKAEVDRMKHLFEWCKTADGGIGDLNYVDYRGSGPSASRTPEGMGGKLGPITLGETTPGAFFDAAFTILEVIQSRSTRVALELYITDGTSSTLPLSNFHGVQRPHIPLEYVFSLAIMGEPLREELPLFQPGKTIWMKNIRGKTHKQTGAYEMIWSELVTAEQAREGWNRRRCGEIDAADERARVIKRRLNALKRGDDPSTIQAHSRQATPRNPTPLAIEATSARRDGSPVPQGDPSVTSLHAAPGPEVPVATHVRTTYQDPFNHPISTLAQVVQNHTVPNRYKVVARVKSVHSRAKGTEDGLVIKHCLKCSRDVATDFCQSCNDVSLSNAELRYRLVAVLEEPGGKVELPVTVADDEAAAFLPALPPLGNLGPNELSRLQQRIKQCNKEALDVLLGAKQDGQRTRPRIEWTIEVFEAKRKGAGGPKGRDKDKDKGGETMRVWRVFGMEAN